jgi:hypothetical protein
VVLAAYALTLAGHPPAGAACCSVALALAVLAKLLGAAVPARRRGRDRALRRGQRDAVREASAPSRTARLRLTYLALLLTMWGGYRFTVGPLLPVGAEAASEPPSTLDRLARAPIFPAPAFFEGLGELAAKNRAGHKSYLLGEVRTTGWWHFFPVALGVKTPIGFLLLWAAGLVVAVRASPGPPRRRLLEPAIIAGAILLVCPAAQHRAPHIPSVYPFLACWLAWSGGSVNSALGPAMAALLGFARTRRAQLHRCLPTNSP